MDGLHTQKDTTVTNMGKPATVPKDAFIPKYMGEVEKDFEESRAFVKVIRTDNEGAKHILKIPRKEYDRLPEEVWYE